MRRRGPQPTGVTAALIYRRVSSEDQRREGVSLADQLVRCRAFVASQPGWVIEAEHEDVLTGKRDDRPGYQALLADVRRLRAANRPAVIVVSRMDRFGRHAIERLRVAEDLKALGVEVHSLREGVPAGLMASILAVLAQEEIERLGERIADARAHIVATGWYFLGRVPLGYRKRPATEAERQAGSPRSVIEPDPITAPTIAEVFRQGVSGESVHAISRWLKGLPPSLRGNRACYYADARNILSSPVYVARPATGVDDVLGRPPGRWQPLVDDKTYGRVQGRLAVHQHMPAQASGRFLLTGLLRCFRCNGRMVGSAAMHRYRCTGYQSGANHPDPRCKYEVSGRKVDAAVLRQVADLLDPFLSPSQAAIDSWRKRSLQARQPESSRIAALEAELVTARRRLADAATLLVDGALDRAGYELLRDREKDVLESVERELARLRSDRPPALLTPGLEQLLAHVRTWSEALETPDTPTKRRVMEVLIDHLVAERTGWAKFRVEVTWSPIGQHLAAAGAALKSEAA